MLACIDGIDGAGKSVQASLLYESSKPYFRNRILVHFPNYNTPTGQLIQQYLYNPPKNQFFFSLLFELNRIEQYDTLWQSADIDTLVIADRYYQSGWVYAMARNDITPRQLKILKAIDSYLPEPDVVIILDMDPREAMERIKTKERDQLEINTRFQDNVRELFKQLAADKHYHILDGSMDKNELANKILHLVLNARDM
jgi:dTMP kinase